MAPLRTSAFSPLWRLSIAGCIFTTCVTTTRPTATRASRCRPALRTARARRPLRQLHSILPAPRNSGATCLRSGACKNRLMLPPYQLPTLWISLKKSTAPANGRVPSYSSPFPLAHRDRSEEHTSELQSQFHLVCRLLL